MNHSVVARFVLVIDIFKELCIAISSVMTKYMSMIDSILPSCFALSEYRKVIY